MRVAIEIKFYFFFFKQNVSLIISVKLYFVKFNKMHIHFLAVSLRILFQKNVPKKFPRLNFKVLLFFAEKVLLKLEPVSRRFTITETKRTNARA